MKSDDVIALLMRFLYDFAGTPFRDKKPRVPVMVRHRRICFLLILSLLDHYLQDGCLAEKFCW